MASLGGYVWCAAMPTVSPPGRTSVFQYWSLSVLFSVLVLHWITSKDNVSTLNSSHHTDNRHHTPPSTRIISLHSIPEEHKPKSSVETYITSAKRMADEDKLDSVSRPPNAITVEFTHMREVVDAGSERGSQSQRRGSDGSQLKKTMTMSDDDFFRKCWYKNVGRWGVGWFRYF